MVRGAGGDRLLQPETHDGVRRAANLVLKLSHKNAALRSETGPIYRYIGYYRSCRDRRLLISGSMPLEWPQIWGWRGYKLGYSVYNKVVAITRLT